MKIFVVIIITLLSLVGSFVAGTRFGTETFIQAEAKFNAALITEKLSDLDNNNLKRLRESLEFDRDLSLIRHGEGENNLLIYMWPNLLSDEYKELGMQSLNRAATYRKNHPTEWVNEITLSSFDPSIRQEVQEHGKILEWVTKKYAE